MSSYELVSHFRVQSFLDGALVDSGFPSAGSPQEL